MAKRSRRAVGGLRLTDDGLEVPFEIATEAIGIVANRGAGKSYASKVLAEELAKAGIPTVVVDPLGVYWGLRSSADGLSPGLAYVVLGGGHGDVPLEPLAGRVIARFVMAERVPVVLDLSEMRKAPMRRFVTEFLDELYHANRSVMHLVIDEADLFAPQRPGRDSLALLGIMEDVVRRGRAKGLGVTLITQRPAVLHKDVLTQISVLIALRLVAPQDRAAIKSWIEVHGTVEDRKEVLDSLPTLATGDGWFWSPSFMGVLQRFRARAAETFDSSATPRMGEARVEPRSFAQVDLDLLREQMAETIERAKAADPAALRKRIRELEAELGRVSGVAAGKERLVEVEVIREVEVVREVVPTGLVSLLDELSVELGRVGGQLVSTGDRVAEARRDLDGAARPAPTPTRVVGIAGDWPADIGKAGKRILTVLAQHGAVSRRRLALQAGYAAGGGGFGNALSKLRTLDLIGTGDPVALTSEGVAAVPESLEQLPVGDELLEYWIGHLGKAESLILRALTEAWPDGLTKDQAAAATGYEAAGGGFGNALSKLRTLDLIVGNRGEPLRAADDLMHGAGR